MIDRDDARLTAYALGELDADAAAAVEAALADDPAARAEVEALRALAGEVRAVLADGSDASLTAVQREAIRASARRGPGRLAGAGWRLWRQPLGLAASLLAVLSIVALMRSRQDPETILAQSVRQPQTLDADRLEMPGKADPQAGKAKAAEATAPTEADKEVAIADAARVAPDANAATSREGVGGMEATTLAAENAGAVATRAATAANEGFTAAAPPPAAPKPMPKPAEVHRPEGLAELAVREDGGLAGRRAGAMAAPGAMAAAAAAPVAAPAPGVAGIAPPAAPAAEAVAAAADEAVAATRSRRSVTQTMDFDAAPQRLEARPGPERAAPLSKAVALSSDEALDGIREAIRQGRLPAPERARVEALVNAFRYDDPPPQGEAALAVHAEVATCPWQPRHRLLRLAVRARELSSTLSTARAGAAGSRPAVAARAASLTLEVLPERLQAWRRIGDDAAAPMDAPRRQHLDLGDLPYGASRVVLFEVVPVGADGDLTTALTARREQTRRVAAADGAAEWLALTLQWSPPEDATARLMAVTVPDAVRPWPDASADLRFTGAVARFAMLLRQGPTPRWEDDTQAVLDMAATALGSPPAAERLDFVDLVRRARDLAARPPPPAP